MVISNKGEEVGDTKSGTMETMKHSILALGKVASKLKLLSLFLTRIWTQLKHRASLKTASAQ